MTTTPITRTDLEGFAENSQLWKMICHKEEARLSVLHALADLNEATQPLIVHDLDVLRDDAVIEDTHGDIGVILGGKIHYPETAPLTLLYAKRYGPFTVLYTGETK